MAVTHNDIFARYLQNEINQVTVDVEYRLQTSGYLIQWHRYKITKSGVGTDFTAVGSPDNVVGTWFNATTGSTEPTWNNGELQAGRSQIDIVDQYLNNARTDLAGYADLAASTVDETNAFQKEFLICQTMALLCENVGLTNKANSLKSDGLRSLYAIWGQVVYNDSDTTQANAPVILKPYAAITKSNYTDFDAILGWDLDVSSL